MRHRVNIETIRETKMSGIPLKTIIVSITVMLTANGLAQQGVDYTERDQLYSDATIAMVKAERERDAGNEENALELFVATLDMSYQLARQYPSWHSHVVEARISYCKSEIRSILVNNEKLRRKYGDELAEMLDAPAPRYDDPSMVEPTEPEPVVPEEPEPVAPEEPEPVVVEEPRLVPEEPEPREDVRPAPVTHAPAPAGSREEALQKEVARLREEVWELTQQYASSDNAKLERELKKTRAEYAKCRTMYEELTREYRDVIQNHDALRREYEDLESASGKLTVRVTQLEADRDELKAENKALEQQLDEARAGNPGGRPDGKASANWKDLEKRLRNLEKSHAAAVEDRKHAEARAENAERAANDALQRADRAEAELAELKAKIARGEPAARETDSAEPEMRIPVPPAESGDNRVMAQTTQLLENGEYAKARELLLKELRKDSSHTGMKLLLGIAYCKEEDYENAIKVLEHVVALKDEEIGAEVRIALGGAYLAVERYDEAWMELLTAIGFEPNLSEGHYNLAQVYLLMTPSDPEKAREEYETAVQLGAERDSAFEKMLIDALRAD